MERLPDVLILLVFSFLEFNDIKSCCLVCRRWHRFALDNINFVLAISFSLPPEFELTLEALASIGDHQVIASLFPCASNLGRDGQLQLGLAHTSTSRRYKRRMPEKKKLNAVLNIFGQKILTVVVEQFKRRSIDQIKADLEASLYTFGARHLPSPPVAVFQRSKNEPPEWNGYLASRKLQLLRFAADDVTGLPESLAVELLIANAPFLRQLNADNWHHVQTAIDQFAANNNGNGQLIFDACRTLTICAASPTATTTPCSSIARHFPALRKLQFVTSRNDTPSDIASLQQLTHLTVLSIDRADERQPGHSLANLWLPNLVELSLGPGIHLPINWNDYDTSGLKSLKLTADLYNVGRLAAHVPMGQNLSSLEFLELKHVGKWSPEFKQLQAAIRVKAGDNLQKIKILPR